MSGLTLDTFGKKMDEFIKYNEIKMLITMPEGTIETDVKDNVGCGSVMQFFIILNAIGGIGQQMKKEMQIEDDNKWEDVVDGLLELVKKDLMVV